jgi:alpha-L-fucosidase
MKACKTALILVGALLIHGAAAPAAERAASETKEQREQRMAWWRSARLGMFIHWGPVSLKGTEISWSRANSNPKCPNKGQVPVEVYDNLYREFNPVKFNADEWVNVGKDAGMKYVVLTAKHCDGFLLWHSKVSDHNIAATPFQRDICAELSAAVRRQGLKLGWYFSPMDWRDPDFRTERNAAFVARMQGEVRELLTGYGQVDLLWFDYDGLEPMYEQATTYPLVKELQPKILLTNRLDLGIGNNNTQVLSPYADYYTPEQAIGGYDDQRPWETCMTLGTQWSWKPNDAIKSVTQVMAILARCVGGDGNLLLNVGPMPDGRIEPRQVEVLEGLGAWMRQNGESIYGTRGGPYKPGVFGSSTRKGNTIYVHALKWDGDTVTLPALPGKVIGGSLLAGGDVKVEQTPSALRLTVAPEHRAAGDTVVKLELAGPAMDIAPIATPREPDPRTR